MFYSSLGSIRQTASHPLRQRGDLLTLAGEERSYELTPSGQPFHTWLVISLVFVFARRVVSESPFCARCQMNLPECFSPTAKYISGQVCRAPGWRRHKKRPNSSTPWDEIWVTFCSIRLAPSTLQTRVAKPPFPHRSRAQNSGPRARTALLWLLLLF